MIDMDIINSKINHSSSKIFSIHENDTNTPKQNRPTGSLLADRKFIPRTNGILQVRSRLSDLKTLSEEDKRYQNLQKDVKRKELVKLSIINGNRKINLEAYMLFSNSETNIRNIKTKFESNYLSKSPNKSISSIIKSKSYNGNASDSDDEEVRDRKNAACIKRGSDLNDDEKKIVNYIIAKKSPVYGFVDFLSSKHQIPRKPN
jgi:hypothetical protein